MRPGDSPLSSESYQDHTRRARYFHPAPAGVRAPILTANGDRLRAKCFSACNGVLARLDLLASGIDSRIVQTLMKHENLAATGRYLGVTVGQQRAALDSLT